MDPSRFGNYLLLQHLASGGMAEVFLATPLEGGEPERLVIKIIRREHMARAEYRAMFLEEGRLNAAVRHRNVVGVLDRGEVDGVPFLALEYVAGIDLRGLLQALALQSSGKPPLPIAVHIVREVALGLHAAHSARDEQGQPLQITHRDVCPHNVLLGFDGRVVISDFGIAQSAAGGSRPSQLTGRAGYLSPEQCAGLAIDHRSDVFSLGILLYEASVGRRLFRGPSRIETQQMIKEARVVPPTAIDPGYPPELESIVLRSLARTPEQRYASAEALARDLSLYLARTGSDIDEPELASYLASVAPAVQAAEVRHESSESMPVLPTGDGGMGGSTAGAVPLEAAGRPPAAADTDPAEDDETPPAPEEEPAPALAAANVEQATSLAAGAPGRPAAAAPAAPAAPLPGPEAAAAPPRAESEPLPLPLPAGPLRTPPPEQEQEPPKPVAAPAPRKTPTPAQPVQRPVAASHAIPKLAQGGAEELYYQMHIEPELKGTRWPRVARVALVAVLVLVAGLLTYRAAIRPVKVPEVVQQPAAPPAAATPVAADATLEVSTQPPGAWVELDLGRDPATSPVRLPVASGRSHALVIQLPGHHAYRTRFFIGEPKGKHVENVTLRPLEQEAALGRVHVETRPEEVQVFWGGTLLGPAPGPFALPADEELVLHLQQAGHVPQSVLVAPRAGLDVLVRTELARIEGEDGERELRVRSLPEGATVAVNGRKLGTTPFFDRYARGALLTLRLEKEGYEPWERDLHLEAQNVQVEARLVPRQLPQAQLAVRCSLPAVVYLDSEEQGKAPVELTVASGKHQVVVETEKDRLRANFHVSLEPGEILERKVVFDENGNYNVE